MLNKKSTTKKVTAVGAGLTAIAATAAAVYLFTGKNAKNRKKMARWAKDLQSDVVKELNKTGKATKASYNKLVDQTAKNYSGLKNISGKEVVELATELKGHWDMISQELSTAGKKITKVIPTQTKSVAKKVKVITKKKVTKKAKK